MAQAHFCRGAIAGGALAMSAGTPVVRWWRGDPATTLLACALGAGALGAGLFESVTGLAAGLAAGVACGVWIVRRRRPSRR